MSEMRFLALVLSLLATSAKADETCIEMQFTPEIEVVDEELAELYNKGMRAQEGYLSLLETAFLHGLPAH